MRKHASYQLKNAWWHFRVWVLRQKLEPLPKFYEHAENLAEGHAENHSQEYNEK